MADYTFNSQAVYDAVTDKVVENATNGKLVAYLDGPALPIFDLNDNPIASITSNPSGQSIMFKANVYEGLVQFGSVAVAVTAQEVATFAVNAQGAIATAEAAQIAAASAQGQADSVELRVAALEAGGVPGPGGGAVSSVAGKTGAVSLVKGDVGLANADNTSDANKPLSLAEVAALALKSNAGHGHVVDDIAGLLTALASKRGVNDVIDASLITAGVIAAARLGAGSPTSTKVLYGDGQWKTPTTSGVVVDPPSTSGLPDGTLIAYTS